MILEVCFMFFGMLQVLYRQKDLDPSWKVYRGATLEQLRNHVPVLKSCSATLFRATIIVLIKVLTRNLKTYYRHNSLIIPFCSESLKKVLLRVIYSSYLTKVTALETILSLSACARSLWRSVWNLTTRYHLRLLIVFVLLSVIHSFILISRHSTISTALNPAALPFISQVVSECKSCNNMIQFLHDRLFEEILILVFDWSIACLCTIST